jgi:hypothetical protein
LKELYQTKFNRGEEDQVTKVKPTSKTFTSSVVSIKPNSQFKNDMSHQDMSRKKDLKNSA